MDATTAHPTGAIYAKEHRHEADVGNEYPSFRAIGIEGVERLLVADPLPCSHARPRT